MVHGTVVVTNEQPRPESRNRVALPDVCRQFNVKYKDTFSMLRELAVQFDLVGGAKRSSPTTSENMSGTS
jgi:hypothetical protein